MADIDPREKSLQVFFSYLVMVSNGSNDVSTKVNLFHQHYYLPSVVPKNKTYFSRRSGQGVVGER
jgi:hypothetical protein